MALVLFDEVHGELLSSRADPEEDRGTDTRTLLEEELRTLGITVLARTDAWDEETLSGC